MAKMRFVCRVDELEVMGSKAVTLGKGVAAIELMVLRSETQILIYLNRCPHRGSPLDWMPGKFFSLDKKHIQCAVHDALFDISTGRCVAGPCLGDELQSIDYEIENGEIRIDEGRVKQAGLAVG